jgi:hypothetical protein
MLLFVLPFKGVAIARQALFAGIKRSTVTSPAIFPIVIGNKRAVNEFELFKVRLSLVIKVPC